MTELEFEKYILKNFKEYNRKSPIDFPTENLKDYYIMLDEEDRNDNYSLANEFYLNIMNFIVYLENKKEYDNDEMQEYRESFGFDCTSCVIDFLYQHKDEL